MTFEYTQKYTVESLPQDLTDLQTDNFYATLSITTPSVVATSVTATSIASTSVTATSIAGTSIVGTSITTTSLTATNIVGTSVTTTSLTATNIVATSFSTTNIVGSSLTATSIGIGTTNPLSPLTVIGNTLITGVTTVGLGTTSAPPSNSQLSFELISNTNLRIRVKGNDGVIRSANITLA